MENRVVAVVVTYNSSDQITRIVESVLPQTEQLILVDNSTDSGARDRVAWLGKLDGVTTFTNYRNEGLAAAQNRGIELARRYSPNWLLLLDDDSSPTPTMVADLLRGAAKIDQEIGLVSPQKLNGGNRTRSILPKKFGLARQVVQEHDVAEVVVTISSGMLIPYERFKEIGAMRDELFIDQVDTEFCLRLRRKNYGVFVVGNALIEHSIGNERTHSVGPVTLHTWNHSPERKFYIYRNRVWLWRNYWRQEPFFVLFEMAQTVKLTLLIICFERNRRQKLKAIARGVWAGFFL